MKNEIRTCTKCPLWKERTLAVPGEGESKVRIFFDKPNSEADRHGTHTVTQYYKDITRFMRKQGITNVYVSSAVKCYGHATQAEYATCSNYLKQEFSVLNILLGNRVALHALGQDVKVSTHAYKTITKGSNHYIVTHHYSQLDYDKLKIALDKFISRYKRLL